MVMPSSNGDGRGMPPESVEPEPGAAGTGEAAAPAEAADAVPEGERILRFDAYATVAFAVVSLLEALLPEPFVVLSVPLDLALFVVGCGAFLWAYAVAVGRSRYDALTMGGVFFPGSDVVSAGAVRVLRLCLLAQVVVAVVAGAVRPFTPAAFAALVPMLGVGLMALYGARHGRFPAKDEPGDQSDEGDAPGQ